MLMSEFTSRSFADQLRGRADWEKRLSDNTRGMDSAYHDSVACMLNEAAERIDRLGDLDDEPRRRHIDRTEAILEATTKELGPALKRLAGKEAEDATATPDPSPKVRRARRSVGKNAGKVAGRGRAKAGRVRRVRPT